MNRREKLQDAYEDALFALLMEDVIEEEGKRLDEENERLNRDPTAAVPRELHEKCMKTIHRRFGQQYRRENGKQTGRSFTKVLNKAAVVVVICMLLFTVAYAVSPELRVATLNLLIEISDVKTILSVGENEVSQASYDTSEAAKKIYDQFGYRIPEMPEGFELIENAIFSATGMLKYKKNDGALITFNFTQTLGGGYSVDTEGARRVEDITVNGSNGLLIIKDNRIQIAWTNTDQNVFVSIVGTSVDEEVLWSIVNNLASDTN